MSNRKSIRILCLAAFLLLFLTGCRQDRLPVEMNVFYLSVAIAGFLIVIVAMWLWFFRQRARDRELLTAYENRLQIEKEKQQQLRRQLETALNSPSGETVESPVAEIDIIGSINIDNPFYTKFLSVLLDNYMNADLNTADMASHFGLGPAQLTRKLKALTGYSPVELLKEYRLKKARELLISTDANISEIAYDVGFSSPPYLSKCFRETYGETPTDLRVRMQNSVK